MCMKPTTVWLNKYLSNTWEILALLREARGTEEFRLISSHPRSRYPGREHADVFEQEPGGLREAEYLKYCLDFVQRNQVDLFIPGRKLLPIVRARDRFESLGARVLAAGDAATLDLLQNKAKVYNALT